MTSLTQPKSTQRVLVTGAGGFVCRHVITACLEAGFGVIAVDQAFDPDLLATWENQPPGQIEVITASDYALPDEPIFAVVHGAAITANPEEARVTPEQHLRANLYPAIDLLEWGEKAGVKRTIFISSSAVYQETNGPITEAMPPTPDGLYAVAKSTIEALTATMRHHYGRDTLTVRLSNIYGPGERTRGTRPRVSGVMQMVDEALHKGSIIIAHPDETRDWTFAPDIGKAIVALITQPELHHALYNVASEQRLSMSDIAQAIQSHLPVTQINLDAEPSQSPLTRRGYLSNQRLTDETGFNNWTSFAEGIQHVIAWAQQRQEMAR